MSVTDIATGDKFIYRVVKSHSANPDRKWANSYEFQTVNVVTEVQLLALGVALVNFEIAIHLGIVVFEKLIISTWEADSVPYDPTSFISTTLTGSGAFGGAGDPIGLTQPLVVARAASYGRNGHLFYRGALTESMVESPAGKTILTDKPGVQDTIGDGLSSSGLGDYIGVTPEEDLRMVLVSADGTQVRPAINLIVQGVTTLPVDHAWFNRTTP